MKLIQLILIVGLLVILVSYFRWFRSAVMDKLLIACILAAGIFLVVFPDLTNRLAIAMGVGRGADLVFYLFIVGFCYLILLVYAKIKKLEQQFAELARRQALQDVESRTTTTA
jgi:small membrane protein